MIVLNVHFNQYFMEIILIVLLLLVLVILSFIAFQVTKPKVDNDPSNMDKSLTFLQNQINALNQQTNEKLDRTIKELSEGLKTQNNTLNEQLSKSNVNVIEQFKLSQDSLQKYTENIKVVTQELTKLGETNKQIQTFAGQLQSLENVLKNPKQRGVLGEYFLETVLSNVLPPNAYEMQYKFSNGEIVDAIIKVKDRLIPVDSKFSLENYNRIVESNDPTEKEDLQKLFKQDLKNRIDETAKYIRPTEGTMDFAFMFIPSEGIYYDLLVNKLGVIKTNTHDLIEYAFKQKKVIIVSPTSFLAYLQTVLQGLNALRIEKQALEIQKNVEKLSKDINTFEDNFSKLGKQMATAVGSYNSAFKNLKSIDKDLYKITGDNLEITSEEVEKPMLISDI